jgi:hypothetical protein
MPQNSNELYPIVSGQQQNPIMIQKSARETQRTHDQVTSQPVLLRSGRIFQDDLRPEWRGFSFSGYWFSYYFAFTGTRPLCAGGKMRPG